VVVGAGEEDRAGISSEDRCTVFADAFGVPFIHSVDVKGDDEDFSFAVICAESGHIKIIGFGNRNIIGTVAGKITADFGRNNSFEPCNFHDNTLMFLCILSFSKFLMALRINIVHHLSDCNRKKKRKKRFQQLFTSVAKTAKQYRKTPSSGTPGAEFFRTTKNIRIFSLFCCF
jgi:hypothetical protein